MSDNNAPLGVFDSGIGGLTVVKELRTLLPGEDIVYFGDTARIPYGSRSPAEILEFMQQILQFMAAQNIKMAVIACNTMTALGLDIARRQYPFMVVGVNTGVRAALKVSHNRNIGVIATQATIASGKHGKALKSANPNVRIYPQACPKFVSLIEQEQLSGPVIEEAAREYLTPLKEAQVDTLILGCTHYPFIGGLINRLMGPGVTLINPARETAMDARLALVKAGRLSRQGRPGTARLCVSADPDKARRLAQTMFEIPVPQFEIVNLPDFSGKRA